MSWLQVGIAAGQARDVRARYVALADKIAAVAQDSGRDVPETLITDHPMWLAWALQQYAIALPDEAPASLVELSSRFDAPWVVVVDHRGRYPEALLDARPSRCLSDLPLALEEGPEPAWLLLRLAVPCPA